MLAPKLVSKIWVIINLDVFLNSDVDAKFDISCLVPGFTIGVR